LRQIFGALKWGILGVSAPKHAVFRCSRVLFRRLFGACSAPKRLFGANAGTPLHISALVRRRKAVPVVHAGADVSAGRLWFVEGVDQHQYGSCADR